MESEHLALVNKWYIINIISWMLTQSIFEVLCANFEQIPKTAKWSRHCAQHVIHIHTCTLFSNVKRTDAVSSANDIVVRNSGDAAVVSSPRPRPGSMQPALVTFRPVGIPVQSSTVRVKYTRLLTLIYSECCSVLHASNHSAVIKSSPRYHLLLALLASFDSIYTLQTMLQCINESQENTEEVQKL